MRIRVRTGGRIILAPRFSRIGSNTPDNHLFREEKLIALPSFLPYLRLIRFQGEFYRIQSELKFNTLQAS